MLTPICVIIALRRERITAREALKHPYILMYSQQIKRHHHHVQYQTPGQAGEPLVRSGSKDSLSGAAGQGQGPSREPSLQLAHSSGIADV